MTLHKPCRKTLVRVTWAQCFALVLQTVTLITPGKTAKEILSCTCIYYLETTDVHAFTQPLVCGIQCTYSYLVTSTHPTKQNRFQSFHQSNLCNKLDNKYH